MSLDIELITSKEEAKEAANLRQIDATTVYGHHLEDAFSATEYALNHLDVSKSDLGTAGYWVPKINPATLGSLQKMACDQEFIPVLNSYSGVYLAEVTSQIWLRLLLYPFKGTKLWDEKLEPHFNHIFFGPILNEKDTLDVFVYDVEVPQHIYFGVETENTAYARRVSDLMFRLHLKCDSRVYTLHEKICSHIKEFHGIQRPDDDINGWRKWYEYYWRLNDRILITDDMVEFMEGRTLVTIDVDFPSSYDLAHVGKIFETEEIVNYVKRNYAQESKKRKPYFKDAVLNLYMDQILSHAYSMAVAGARVINTETVKGFIESMMKDRSTKYSFFAAVRNDYLARTDK